MNDLNLRVSGGIGEKVKKPAAPITMADWNTEKPSSANEFIKKFLDSKSADEQLKLLKQYLNTNGVHLDEIFVEFLVSLFWGADAKHPVKGFLKKHITESATLRVPFSQRLSAVIKDQIKESANRPYGHYVSVVTRLDTCIDKFPPGAAVVCDMEIDIAMYLLHCLESCVATLSKRDGGGETLAPTEINKIYDLAHLTLRLLLYMIQKVTDGNRSELQRMFERLRAVTAELMVGEEVPMDTKSVSGIVALNLHLFENGPDSWIELLDKEPTSRMSGTVDLCMYSAVATALPRPALLAAASRGRPALLELTDKVLDIGDRYSSDPSHALAVARTVLAISKTLVTAELALAKPLAARLAGYCWPQLDHHMDSVRHLAAQTMAYVVGTCVDMEKAGDPSPLESLFSALETLGGSRGAWAARAQLAGRLGRRVRARSPAWLPAAAAALPSQPQQASATIFLETLLDRYTQECSPETVYREYVQVVLEAARVETEPSALAVLEKVLAKAVQWDSRILEYILPDKSQLSTYQGSDLKCILLVLGVARKSGAAIDPTTFDQLSDTAFDSDDEIRLLALRLVALSPSSTARLLRPELRFVLRWLRHNLNAQAPGFRQLMLTHTKKILRRLEDSLNLQKSQRSVPASSLEAGAEFCEELRQLCFSSLVAGAGYGRRACALQLLVAQRRAASLCQAPWTEERAELLYNVLEDTYEGNKALALEVLEDCPTEFISKLEGPGEQCVQQLLRQASRVKPTECVSAAYKLLLLCRRDAAPLDPHTEGYPERAWFCLSRRLLRELRAQAGAGAGARAPLFGLLHCLHKAVGCVHPQAIAGHAAWSQLVEDIIAMCWRANALAEPVVSAASPEGLLPDHGDVDSDGRPVTAQMVLMCAWRCVKETSLLLGSLVSRLCLEGESAAWTLSAEQVEDIGGGLAGLLARARHRGAFEQAYVGFSALLARLWKCSSARLHQLPLQWFADIERDFLLPAPPEGATEYCATRRGAGLPFMIQALVTTELAAESTVPVGRLLSRCVSLCLRARGGPEAAARAHLVLRALFRHAQPSAQHTAEAVISAVRGFDADTWMERNAATLLFAALTVRVFGVQRGRDARRLSARNRMTARIFFLRYPQLYDFMLEQLRSDSLEWVRPALFPALLLLARLYPSALEGTVSNLKLERFLPLVSRLAGARDIATRRLAARALPPLVAPHKYMAHIQSLFEMLGDVRIKTNLCHGILCQLSALLECWGCACAGAWLARALGGSRRLAAAPCCLLADEYLGVLLLLLVRFPEPGLLDEELTATGEHISRALFAHTRPRAAGRHVYFANAALMLLLIHTTCRRDVTQTTIQCLTHTEYEVQLSAMNYLLTLHGQSEDTNAFLDQLSRVSDSDTLCQIQSYPNYMDILCTVAKSAYRECAQKALKLIAISPKCPEKQHRLVQLKLGDLEPLTHERVVTELLDSALNAPENTRHIYLESVVELVSQCYHTTELLPVLRTLYEHCSAAADERSRSAVVGFLEMNYARLLSRKGDGDELWCVAMALAAAAALLEDDELPLRARTAKALAAAHAAPLLEDDEPPLRARTAKALAAAHAAPLLEDDEPPLRARTAKALAAAHAAPLLEDDEPPLRARTAKALAAAHAAPLLEDDEPPLRARTAKALAAAHAAPLLEDDEPPLRARTAKALAAAHAAPLLEDDEPPLRARTAKALAAAHAAPLLEDDEPPLRARTAKALAAAHAAPLLEDDEPPLRARTAKALAAAHAAPLLEDDEPPLRARTAKALAAAHAAPLLEDDEPPLRARTAKALAAAHAAPLLEDDEPPLRARTAKALAAAHAAPLLEDDEPPLRARTAKALAAAHAAPLLEDDEPPLRARTAKALAAAHAAPLLEDDEPPLRARTAKALAAAHAAPLLEDDEPPLRARTAKALAAAHAAPLLEDDEPPLRARTAKALAAAHAAPLLEDDEPPLRARTAKALAAAHAAPLLEDDEPPLRARTAKALAAAHAAPLLEDDEPPLRARTAKALAAAHAAPLLEDDEPPLRARTAKALAAAHAAPLLEDDEPPLRARTAKALAAAHAAPLLEDDEPPLRARTAKALAAAHAAPLLEDDEPPLRARTAKALAAAHAGDHTEMTRRHHESSSSRRGVLASRAAQLLREWAAAQPALLLLLAALDFRAAVLSEDQLDDESRVFDQNETHNVYLEEFTWTVDCANKIKKHFADGLTGFRTIDDFVSSLVNENRDIIEQLCIEDAIPCLTGQKKSANSKMDLFWKILHQ